jgi:hypothetical protein
VLAAVSGVGGKMEVEDAGIHSSDGVLCLNGWTVTLPYASPPYRGWTIEEHYTEPLHMRFPTPVNRWIGELSAQGAIGNQGFLQRGNLEPPVEIYFYKRSIMPPAYRHVFFTGGCDYKTACVKIFKSPANFQIFPPDLIFYFIL